MEENVKIIPRSIIPGSLGEESWRLPNNAPECCDSSQVSKSSFTQFFPPYFFPFSASRPRSTTSWWIGPKTLNFKRKRLMCSPEFSFLLSLRCLTFGTGAITCQNHTNSSAETFSFLYARFSPVRRKLKLEDSYFCVNNVNKVEFKFLAESWTNCAMCFL